MRYSWFYENYFLRILMYIYKVDHHSFYHRLYAFEGDQNEKKPKVTMVPWSLVYEEENTDRNLIQTEPIQTLFESRTPTSKVLPSHNQKHPCNLGLEREQDLESYGRRVFGLREFLGFKSFVIYGLRRWEGKRVNGLI